MEKVRVFIRWAVDNGKLPDRKPGRSSFTKLGVLLVLGMTATILFANPDIATGQTAECTTSTYGTADEAKANYSNDCGQSFEETSQFRCDWVPGGWECSGPGNSSPAAPAPAAPTPTPSSPAPSAPVSGCADGLGGVYGTADEAKANYNNDCGQPFQNTTAFRCDWVSAGGWQCSGPATSPTEATPTPTPPTPTPPTLAPVSPAPSAPVSGCADGLGGVYGTADEAKANYNNDCGQPFQNTTAFRCDWVSAGGWQCSGPATSPTEATPTPAAPAPSAPAPAPAPNRDRVVVSMGDSYISGESGHLIGNYSAERRANAYEAGTADGCRRSDVAPIQSAAIPGVTALNIACSGALTTDIGRASQPDSTTGRFGERLQIHQLRDIAATSEVEMVVVSIGGNDLGFGELGAACVGAFALGVNCEFIGDLQYEPRVTGRVKTAVANTIAEIEQVLANAGQSDARIVLQSYPSPVPADTTYNDAQRVIQGCAIQDSDMLYINTQFVPLIDSTWRDIANQAGIDFLSLANTFDGKELCSPSVTTRNHTGNHAELEWATGIRLAGEGPTPESLHPNALGQEAMGRCVRLVWESNSSSNVCYNNGGDPSDMRLGGTPTASARNVGSAPICESASSDPDRDGWGWANGQNCRIADDFPAENVDCEGVSGSEARLCGLIMERINSELDFGRVSLDEDGLLFTYDNPENVRINTSSCTNRASVRNIFAQARIGSGFNLDLSGNAITEPLAVRLEVPFDLSGRIDARSKLGYQTPLGCSDIGEDNYYATASASGTADVILAFHLDPSFETNANGDLVLTIEPRAHIAMDLRDPDFNFRVGGTDAIAQFYAFTSGFGTLLGEGIVAGVSGDSISDSLESNALNVGIPVAVSAADQATNSLIFELIEEAGERLAVQGVNYFAPELEIALNEQISTALELDASGQREFVVPANFAQLLQGGATLDDLLAAVQ